MTTRRSAQGKGQDNLALRLNPSIPSKPPVGVESVFARLIWRAYELHYLLTDSMFDVVTLPSHGMNTTFSSELKSLSEYRSRLSDKDYILKSYLEGQLSSVTRYILLGSRGADAASIDGVRGLAAYDSFEDEPTRYGYRERVGMTHVFEEWSDSHHPDVEDTLREWVSENIHLGLLSPDEPWEPSLAWHLEDESYSEMSDGTDVTQALIDRAQYIWGRFTGLGHQGYFSILALLIGRIWSATYAVNGDNPSGMERYARDLVRIFKEFMEDNDQSEWSIITRNAVNLILDAYGSALAEKEDLEAVPFTDVFDSEQLDRSHTPTEWKEDYLESEIDPLPVHHDLWEEVYEEFSSLGTTATMEVVEYYYEEDELFEKIRASESWHWNFIKTWMNVRDNGWYLQSVAEEDDLGERVVSINRGMDISHNNGPMGEHVASFTGMEFPHEWDRLSGGVIHPDVISAVREPTEAELLEFEGKVTDEKFLTALGAMIDAFTIIEAPVRKIEAHEYQVRSGMHESRLPYFERELWDGKGLRLALGPVEQYHRVTVEDWSVALDKFWSAYMNFLDAVYQRVRKVWRVWESVPVKSVSSVEDIEPVLETIVKYAMVRLKNDIDEEDILSWSTSFLQINRDIRDSIFSSAITLEENQLELKFMGPSEMALLLRSMFQAGNVRMIPFKDLFVVPSVWEKRAGKSDAAFKSGSWRQAVKFSLGTVKALDSVYGRVMP